MRVTWDEGDTPPAYEHGLPSEIHFWSCSNNILLLRDTNDQTIPTWCCWRPGQAIKDCGVEYV